MHIWLNIKIIVILLAFKPLLLNLMERILLWAQSVKMYFTARRKLKFVISEKLSFSDAKSPEPAQEE